MEGILVGIVSILLSSSLLCQFFIDYKKDRFFVASIELVVAIMFIACGVCAMWNFTLQTIT